MMRSKTISVTPKEIRVILRLKEGREIQEAVEGTDAEPSSRSYLMR
jgi:hypothetical protein